MKNSVIAIESFVIPTIVYALLAPLYFLKWIMLLKEKKTLLMMVTDETTFSQQLVESKECKSPCPSSAEMCIAMCA